VFWIEKYIWYAGEQLTNVGQTVLFILVTYVSIMFIAILLFHLLSG